jgi:hypothetical protein
VVCYEDTEYFNIYRAFLNNRVRSMDGL